MTTTRTTRSLLFLGLLAAALLSATWTVLAEAPPETPKPEPAPNLIDDWFTGPAPEEGSPTCKRAPWGIRTLGDLQCLELPELVPSFW